MCKSIGVHGHKYIDASVMHSGETSIHIVHLVAIIAAIG